MITSAIAPTTKLVKAFLGTDAATSALPPDSALGSVLGDGAGAGFGEGDGPLPGDGEGPSLASVITVGAFVAASAVTPVSGAETVITPAAASLKPSTSTAACRTSCAASASPTSSCTSLL